MQANLEKAIEELTKARAEGDAANAERLNAAIDALTKAYKAADELLKSDIKALEESTKQNLSQTRSELEQEIADLKGELQTLKGQFEAQNLENSKTMQALAATDAAQQEDLHSLRILAAAGLCISILSFLGNIVLLVLYLKKKAGMPAAMK